MIVINSFDSGLYTDVGRYYFMNGKSIRCDITKHCGERYAQRFSLEKVQPLDSKIQKELVKSNFWLDNSKGVLYAVYNTLKVYVLRFDGSRITALTVYPYTKAMKFRLNRSQRTANLLKVGMLAGGNV